MNLLGMVIKVDGDTVYKDDILIEDTIIESGALEVLLDLQFKELTRKIQDYIDGS